MGTLEEEGGSKFLDVYDTIALTIHSNNDIIDGRTTIQKLIYFNSIIIPTINISGYKHYFYGPFNRDVASSLEEMSAFSFINEIVKSGFYESYTYELTEKGKLYTSKLIQNHKQEFEQISETVKICNDFCKLKTNPLSYAAKAYYILTSTVDGRKGKYNIEDVKKVGENFDWNISTEDAEKGVELLQKLKLVNVT